jgi:CheY-like chemotaxis protein
MSANDVVDALLRLLEIVSAWPVILLLILLIFRRPIGKFTDEYAPGLVKRVKSVQVGGSAVEFAEVASDALQTAVNKGAEEYQDNTQEFANFVREQAIKLRDTAAMPSADRLDLQGRHILWVDDKPVNNAFERAIMERSGATVSLATSTEEALQKVRQGSYDVIISDMGRAEKHGYAKQAGYDLLGELQTLSITTPFIIYTGSESPEQIAEAKRRGAFGLTKSPQQLLGLVSSAVQNTRDA